MNSKNVQLKYRFENQHLALFFDSVSIGSTASLNGIDFYIVSFSHDIKRVEVCGGNHHNLVFVPLSHRIKRQFHEFREYVLSDPWFTEKLNSLYEIIALVDEASDQATIKVALDAISELGTLRSKAENVDLQSFECLREHEKAERHRLVQLLPTYAETAVSARQLIIARRTQGLQERIPPKQSLYKTAAIAKSGGVFERGDYVSVRLIHDAGLTMLTRWYSCRGIDKHKVACYPEHELERFVL